MVVAVRLDNAAHIYRFPSLIKKDPVNPQGETPEAGVRRPKTSTALGKCILPWAHAESGIAAGRVVEVSEENQTGLIPLGSPCKDLIDLLCADFGGTCQLPGPAKHGRRDARGVPFGFGFAGNEGGRNQVNIDGPEDPLGGFDVRPDKAAVARVARFKCLEIPLPNGVFRINLQALVHMLGVVGIPGFERPLRRRA